MADQTGPDRADTRQLQTRPDQTTSGRIVAYLPLSLALVAVGLVWLGGAVWSLEEQTAFARSLGFALPVLLPLVLDGMAIAMAAVAFAAGLDARPAVLARLGTVAAVVCSAASNGSWAWTRTAGDVQTITLAAGVPVVANAAFEVLLAEVRRQVLRRRGQPGPVAITYPRLIRLVLAPVQTTLVWRRLVLAATDPAAAYPRQTRPDRLMLATAQAGQPASVPDQPDQTRPALSAKPRPAAADRRAAITSVIRPAAPDQTGPAAVRNALQVADRWPDRTPRQKEIERALGWGSARARAALVALPHVRDQTRSDQTGPDR
jgi:hypothetical protein